jgi:galactokinase
MASSSTVVVSSALAALAVNDLKMDRRELTVCLGRGEWYVGTRGGFGDHGAMLLGKRGHILHSIFLTVEEMQPEYIPLPQDYQVIIINSYKTSTKSADRLFAYNQTMFAYSMALTLIKDALTDMGKYSVEFLHQLNYLGQITPEIFGLQTIYEVLRALPERITVAELRSRYSASEIDGRLDRFFGLLGRFPDSVEVRGATLWGIAESERSRVFARLVKDGRIKEAGELMYIGHDGDRLFTFRGGKPIEFTENKVTDDHLNALMADLLSDQPDRVRQAQLARQPGDFSASSLELDTIVEIAHSTPGIIGASLTGAGFGGNVLALGEKSDSILSALRDALFQRYYEPQEQAELKWLKEDRELQAAFEDSEELRHIKHRLGDIVERKQKTKTRMSETDIKYTESVQRKINALFKVGKIKRELLFIPADYYTEGVVVNVPVEKAGVL